MAANAKRLLCQIPTTILACIAGSLVVVFGISRVMNREVNPSLVAILSAVSSAAAIAIELRGSRKPGV